jgi:hypothetical protein
LAWRTTGRRKRRERRREPETERRRIRKREMFEVRELSDSSTMAWVDY